MVSEDHSVASPKKRSHSEFESDQTGIVKENDSPDEGKVVHSHLFLWW